MRAIQTQAESFAWRTADDGDYQGQHTSPGPGQIPLHDLTGDSGIGGLPGDWMTHPQYYSYGEVSAPSTRKVQRMYQRTQGNPDAPVDIYRALPKGQTSFNTGDWVTPSEEYARVHARHESDPSQDMPVIKSTVPAKHLWHNGDSYYEMGYHGPTHQGKVI